MSAKLFKGTLSDRIGPVAITPPLPAASAEEFEKLVVAKMPSLLGMMFAIGALTLKIEESESPDSNIDQTAE